MIFNCLLASVGSREPVTMSRLIGAAALAKGFDVRGFENSDMAQFGGSVVSHIRLGQDIQSPHIPRGKAELLIALDPAEAVRLLALLSPTGRVVVLDKAPVSGTGAEKKYKPEEMLAYLKAFMSHPSEERAAQKDGGDWLTVVSTEVLIKACGGSQALNTALLGVAAGKKFFPFIPDDLSAIFKDHISPENLEIYVRAFNAGRALSG